MTQISVWCHQTIFDTNMLKSFPSWKAYSDGAVSENPCRGRQEWAYTQTLIFLRRRNNIISVALTYHGRVAEVQLLPVSVICSLKCWRVKSCSQTSQRDPPLPWTDLRCGRRQTPAKYLLPGAICGDPHRLKVARRTLGSSLPTLREYPSAGLVIKGLKCKFPGHSLKMSFSQNAINKLVVIFCCLKLTSNQGN